MITQLSFASSGSIPSLLKLVLVSHLHSITNINSARYLYIHAIKIVSMSLIQEAYLLSRMIYYFTSIPITSQVPHLHWSGRMRIAVDMLLTQIKWTSSKPTAGDGKGATLDDPSVDIGCLDGNLFRFIIVDGGLTIVDGRIQRVDLHYTGKVNRARG
ncbi:hypothetical protein SDJN02_14089, partial [Cucurbita argyrosperma subsp. argyrosperma]